GDHSYFHNRKDGPWGSYVLKEAIPRAIRVLRADPRRVALGGVSMGGFGALDLARLAPRRFCAIGGHSAAMWEQASDTAPGAFDGPVDFRRHDVFAYVGASRHPYGRSEEHTSELQSRGQLVCRLLLEKKKTCPTVLD